MKRDRTNVSQWPAFDSPPLQEIAAAFLRRRKAIRYRTGLTYEREFSETDRVASERLNLDLRGSNDLRLSVWEDGVMWLRLCVPEPGPNTGWAFMDHFHGCIQQVSPETLVAMVEATIAESFRPGSSDPADYRERLRTIWRRVKPQVE